MFHDLAASVGTAETSVEKIGNTLGVGATEVGVKLVQGIARARIVAEAVDRQQIGAVGVLLGVGDAMARIIDDTLGIDAIGVECPFEPVKLMPHGV